MATKNQEFRTLAEYCGNCERETSHQVSVQIRTESKKEQNSEFSREPYRVTECLVCNEVTSQRMNNA